MFRHLERLLWRPVVPLLVTLYFVFSVATCGVTVTRAIGVPLGISWLGLALYDARSGGRLYRWLSSPTSRRRAHTTLSALASKSELPVLTMRDGPMFPEAVDAVAINSPSNLAAALEATSNDHLMIAIALRDGEIAEASDADYFTVGCILRIERVRHSADHTMIVLDVRGLARAHVKVLRDRGSHRTAVIELIADAPDAVPPIEGDAVRRLRTLARETLLAFGKLSKRDVDDRLASAAPRQLVDHIVANTALVPTQQQYFLETTNVSDAVALIFDPRRLQFRDTKALEMTAHWRHAARRLLDD